MVERGMVRWFNPDRGFGFITRRDGSPEAFVHYKSIMKPGTGHRNLQDGDEVTFEVVDGSRGPLAINVRKVYAPLRFHFPEGGFFKLKRIGDELEIQPIPGESFPEDPIFLIPGVELVVG